MMETRYVGHPLILALFRHLPPPGTAMSEDKCQRWMDATEAVIRLVYDTTPSPKRKHRIAHIDPPY